MVPASAKNSFFWMSKNCRARQDDVSQGEAREGHMFQGMQSMEEHNKDYEEKDSTATSCKASASIQKHNKTYARKIILTCKAEAMISFQVRAAEIAP
jgi:hypothetical protein